MKTIRMKNSTLGVKIAIIGFTGLFLVNALFNLYPVFFALMNTMKTAIEFDVSMTALPTVFTLKNFFTFFNAFNAGLGFTYWELLSNTLWILVVNTFCQLLASLLLAYA
jgi:ABC-type glycerol-3-phosphate transport system permease component